ncbi:MAG: ABC transporter permease [Candidatus Sericytochromatia bacterium]|nr:ABC transporter permease [Candidatus Sericytochromatia bacterium]
MNLPALFWAELQREAILLVRHPFELVSRLFWNLGFALMIFFGFQSVGSGLPGFQEGQMGRMLGLLITYIAINGISNGVDLLLREAQTGTLEQAALSPPPLVVVLLMRDLASYIEMLARFALVLAIAVGITGVQFHLDVPGMALLLTLMYLGMEGLGLMLAAVALLYKRIVTLNQLAVMLVFGLAILPLEGLPGWMSAFVAHFPFTQALQLLRDLAVKGVPLVDLWASGRILSLSLHAVLFLGIGALVFHAAERKARDWGTLNQY